jgi:hypothetical protein
VVKRDRQAIINRKKEQIFRDPNTAFAVLRVVWERQTPWEQFTHEHDAGHDGRGFSEEDTRPLNVIYERWEEAGFRWKDLSAVDVERVRRACQKYARQYLDAEDERREAQIAASRSWVSGALNAKEEAQAASQDPQRGQEEETADGGDDLPNMSR